MPEDSMILTSNLNETFKALRNRDPSKVSKRVVENHPDYKRIPRHNYAPTTGVNTGSWGTGMTRTASTGNGIIYGQPQFFSPVHTPINWQIPSKRLEQYQWCFVPNSNVLMSNGENKYIQDIEKGEYVITHNGESKIVMDIGKRMVEENIMKIKVAGLSDTISTTVNHEFYIIEKKAISSHFKTKDPYPYKYLIDATKKDINAMINWKPSVSLEKGDYAFTPWIKIDKVNDKFDEYDENKFLDLMFILGLYTAEGCFAWYKYKDIKRPKGLRFCINKKETIILDRLKKAISNVCGKKLNIYNNGETESYDIHVYDKKLALFVYSKIFGIAKNKSIDEYVLNASNQGLIEFLTGYISGDGHLNQTNNYIDCVTASEALSVNLSYIMMRLKIPFRIYSYGNDKYNGFHVVLDGDVCKNYGIKKLGYSFADNDVKSKSIIVTPEGLLRRISNINVEHYSGFVYNIEVFEQKSYIVNFVSVHNSRFFYENEPKVAASIDFYSDFPMNDFEHECRNRDVKIHFDKLKDKLEIPKWCRLISHEVHLLGDCFPFVEIECPECFGTGKIGDEICEHEGGTIRRIVILNPDYVEVHTTSINPDPIIALRPDEELINMVQRKIPGYEKLSPEVIKLISTGQPIRLDNRNVSHLKYGECGYTKFGVGMVRRLFPILSYKTKLMVAQWIVAERLIVPIKIVKVGSDDRPAGPADIADVQAQLAQTANDPNLTLVTHHAFDLDFVGAAGRVLTLSNEFEFINQEILDGMMINNALLNGEGPNFSSAAVGIEAMIQRLETFRSEIARWIEKNLYLPESKRQGFVEENPETGEKEYIVPKIKWSSMHLRDQQQYRTFIIQLYDKGLLSAQTVLEAFDLDPDQEIERKRYDALQFMAIGEGFGQQGAGGEGFGGGGGGGGMPPMGGGGGAGGEPPIGAPGAEMGGPGTPGGEPGQVGGGVGGPMPKAAGMTANIADPSQFGGKVLKKKTRDRVQSEQQKIFRQQETHGVLQGQKDANGQIRDEKGRVMFTKCERQLIPLFIQAQKDGLISDAIYPQYDVTAAGTEYPLDFGIPSLQIGIEADGEVFHGSPKQIEKDTARDAKLQQQGWTILRFTDTEIEKQGTMVIQTLVKEVMRKKMWLEQNAKNIESEQQKQHQDANK